MTRRQREVLKVLSDRWYAHIWDSRYGLLMRDYQRTLPRRSVRLQHRTVAPMLAKRWLKRRNAIITITDRGLRMLAPSKAVKSQ